MHIIIMGCGRTGAALALEFDRRGHSVAIIDQDIESFRRLPTSFRGEKVVGVGFDRETLLAAGIKEAYGFAAVSDGDNSNILAARVAKETYDVEQVVARIADPQRAAIYQRLGISTVATVPWVTAKVVTSLLPGEIENIFADEEVEISIRSAKFHPAWAGMKVTDIAKILGINFTYLKRQAAAVFPDSQTVLQAGDIAVIAVPQAVATVVDKAINKAPEVE